MPALRHYPELDGKTFVLGVGAMKCATSWVFGYLESLPGMTASPIKELHFFNTRLRPQGHVPFTADMVQVVTDALVQAEDVAAEVAANPQLQAGIDSMRMLYDQNAYFDFFARLSGPDTVALCEITPQYQVLGRDGFAHVQAFFASQKMHLKVLLILRDPVERLWSHLRHLAQRDPALDIAADLPSLLRQRAIIERSDYWQTIDALDAVFPPEDLLILFYEELFAGDGLQRLCAFAGLPYRPPAAPRRNETAVKTPLPGPIRTMLRRVLAPQYAYCSKRFGEAVPASWQG